MSPEVLAELKRLQGLAAQDKYTYKAALAICLTDNADALIASVDQSDRFRIQRDALASIGRDFLRQESTSGGINREDWAELRAAVAAVGGQHNGD